MTDVKEVVQGFRDLADLLEAQPALAEMVSGQTIYMFHRSEDVQDFARKALMMGDIQKTDDGTFFNVNRSFGPIRLQLTARHELVCERIVIDSEDVEVEERDEEAVAEALASVPVRKVTKTIERTEWKCPTLLAAANLENA